MIGPIGAIRPFLRSFGRFSDTPVPLFAQRYALLGGILIR
jgi:hypothetical protein